ncbi:hypothetical protein CEH05_19995 [Halobacillus halophilus]|uniref:Uncharacterized protein n=1 Tax=Halobacillus halophilus (strain ATCC 35676 / DSM 2266 / JCM 20832 / KCTC 3685 / LMG 17431 / NBRC 102448 / NCIMB 2269) TaxID=866895 RepID=I0JTE1_HALH3|nr:hypothetical protein [Halobacillus halophilus]ASF41323.1 hypothetical protein CEH05_19995 [Halobacillus halophilus]CCG47413.1 hypothetical protein HBHAL_5078 [Halobacillus halophilus DSM 2266]
MFYLENNDVFTYFDQKEIYGLKQSLEYSNTPSLYSDLLLVIHKGIEPFFNYPSNLNTEAGIISFIPLLEHIIGSVFNLLIIGFFVSYSVGKLLERRNSEF